MHPPIESTTLIEAQAGESQDRAIAVQVAGGTIVAVADGAGGSGDGGAAAQAVVDRICPTLGRNTDMWNPRTWSDLLREIDDDLFRSGVGETTAVILAVSSTRIAGAVLGDSHAWLVGQADYQILTEGSRRKPLLGRGEAIPACFTAATAGSTLLVATDGLFNYVQHARIVEIVRAPDLRTAARSLADAARLPSGGFQDDLGLVLCRAAAVVGPTR